MTPLIKINKCYQEELRKCLALYIGVLLCMYKPGISAGAKCGRPGRTVNSTYRPSGEAFNENDVIHYICTEKDHVILGSAERKCQRNGTWSGEIPVCSKLAKFEDTQLLFHDPENGVISTVDGNVSTCSGALKYNRTVWRGYFSTCINVSAVRITVLGMTEVDVSVTIQEEGSLLWKRCKIKGESSDVIMKSTVTLTFYCPTGTFGKYVQVACSNKALRICEISVLLLPVPFCLLPDTPLHGIGWRISSGRETMYQFECDDGYKRWGELLVHCLADGRWSPESPVCKEIYCIAPNSLENGNVTYDSNKGIIPYKGIARYTCNEGFYLEGHSTVTCYRWDEWDFQAPVCKPRISTNTEKPDGIPTKEMWRQSKVTHCGNLPHIANGALIVNSSSVGSTAWLKCQEGFKPLNHNYITCLSTGMWSSQSLRCTIIQCEANPIIPYGKATLLDNSSYYGAHLEIKCNPGYTSHTPISRKCNEVGTWGDLNICVEITCGTFTTNEATRDEWLPINGSTYIRVLICPDDFHIEGSPAVIRCLSNGSWSYSSAKCKRSFTSLWGSNWTPSLMLIAAIGAGAGTAILILCLSVAFLTVRKRCQSQTNTTVFHLEDISHKDGMGQSNIHRQKHSSVMENFKNEVERRSQSVFTNPRKSHSALPNLPIDADPVYAQPFETATVTKKTSFVRANKRDDLYNTHIYAEPVDSRRQTPTHVFTSMTMSQMGTDTRISPIKTNSVYESPTPIQTDQQNCDKKCAIYDSSLNATLNSGQLTSDEKYQRYNDNTEFGTLTNNLEYLEFL